MSITTKEIARLCGVSRGTVDRALNGKPGISPATREIIRQTAAEHGYTPDYIGRSLVKGKTFSLGVIVFDLNNPYFSQLLNAVEVRARQAGYAVMIMLSEGSVANEQAAVRKLHERRVDGLILHPVGFGSEYEAFLRQSQLPVVVVGNRLSPQFDYIRFDIRAAGADAAAEILRQGYRRIIYVAPPLRKAGQVNIAAQEERQAGFQSVAAARQTPYRIITAVNYLDLLQAELNRADAAWPAAIFCSSDVFALEIQNALRCGQLAAPSGRTAGLMGFDNIDILKYIRPRLATVANPIAEIGAQAVDRLLARIQDDQLPPQEIVVPHQVLAGATICPNEPT